MGLGLIQSTSPTTVPDGFRGLWTSITCRTRMPNRTNGPNAAGAVNRIVQSVRSKLVPESDVAMCKDCACAPPASVSEVWLSVLPSCEGMNEA